jgi:hypothetical protein
MYFAQAIMRLHPQLRWSLPLGSKRFIDYGQPVLEGFQGDVPLNPVRVVTNLAFGIARGKRNPTELAELLDTWSAQVK